MKVGRTALDEEAIRLLEERHPDVPFDWERILREPPQPISPIESEKRREAREAQDARRRKRSRREEQEQEQERARRKPPEAAAAFGGEAVRGSEESPPESGDESAAPFLEEAAAELAEEAEAELAAETPARSLEEAAEERLEGGADELLDLRGTDTERADLPASHPLLDLVGAEGFMRLRARHASLTARIAQVQDGVRREALRLAAEPLNPDQWLTPEDAKAALETYEANYEALRAQLGRKRRRRRRKRGGGQKPV